MQFNVYKRLRIAKARHQQEWEASVHPCEVGILLPILRDGETEAQSD